MQKITTELQTKFQTKNRTFFLLKCIFDKALHTSFILQRCGKTSSHQRCSLSQRNIFSQMFYKTVAFKRFSKFTGKHLCLSHFLIKLQA